MADNLQVPKDLKDDKAVRSFLTELINTPGGAGTTINKTYEIKPTTAIPMDTTKYDNHIKYDEMFDMFKSAIATSYAEYTYDSDSKVSNIDIWDTSGKVTKLFSKVITYSGTQVSSISLTDEQTITSLTMNYTYDSDGKLTNKEVS